jgi:hypothetical protein
LLFAQALIAPGLSFNVENLDFSEEFDPSHEFFVLFSMAALLDIFLSNSSLIIDDHFLGFTVPTPLFLTASPIHAPPA